MPYLCLILLFLLTLNSTQLINNNSRKLIYCKIMGSHTSFPKPSLYSCPLKNHFLSIPYAPSPSRTPFSGRAVWGVGKRWVAQEGGTLLGSHAGTQRTVCNISVSTGGQREVVISALEKGPAVEGQCRQITYFKCCTAYGNFYYCKHLVWFCACSTYCSFLN